MGSITGFIIFSVSESDSTTTLIGGYAKVCVPIPKLLNLTYFLDSKSSEVTVLPNPALDNLNLFSSITVTFIINFRT